MTKPTSKKTTKKAADASGSSKSKSQTPDVSAEEKKRAQRVFRKLEKQYPDAQTALNHRNAFELLIATILSAQCTDERVNKTTPELFDAYPTPDRLARSKQEDVEKIIKSCGFYRNKAKSIRAAAQAIVDQHGGEVPATMEQLVALPGVARKTANCVLGNAFDINEGVVVDTHVKRLSFRLGFTEQTNPDKIERDLMARFPRPKWTKLAHLLIFHGRQVCQARKPDCPNCVVNADCPKVGVS